MTPERFFTSASKADVKLAPNADEASPNGSKFVRHCSGE